VASLGRAGVIATVTMSLDGPGPVSTRGAIERCPRLLVVDDDEVSTRSITRVLRLARPRWAVTVLGTVTEAARELERGDYDVAVVDLALPGLPGTALLEVARLRHPGVARVVFARLGLGAERHPEVRDADAVLARPAAPDQLVSALALALRTSASRRAPRRRDGERLAG